jgi:hypothetical protein
MPRSARGDYSPTPKVFTDAKESVQQSHLFIQKFNAMKSSKIRPRVIISLVMQWNLHF